MPYKLPHITMLIIFCFIFSFCQVHFILSTRWQSFSYQFSRLPLVSLSFKNAELLSNPDNFFNNVSTEHKIICSARLRQVHDVAKNRRF